MYRFYVVSHEYGTDLLSWNDLVDYVYHWWNDYKQLADTDPYELTPAEAVRTYFDFHAEYGYSEFYTEHAVEDTDIDNFKERD